MADLQTKDPRQVDFWDERFGKHFTPWDKGGVPIDLQDFLKRETKINAQAHACLIPGCGQAYEAQFLAAQGWQVAAIDFSIEAVTQAKEKLGNSAHLVEQADFFTYQVPFAVNRIYERAFFCALPPAMRVQIVARWAELLPAQGLLFGYFFIDDDLNASRKGPPFRTSSSELESLMADDFIKLEDQASQDALAVFESKERWQVWQRR